MTKQEKIIKGLECCLPAHDPDCDLCPYDDIDLRCRTKLRDDIIALLKEQEARVMTLEEVKNRKEPMFLETKSFSDWCLLCYSNDESWFCVTMRDGSRVHYFGKLYGKSYRCWTSRPDEKRRTETPWE